MRVFLETLNVIIKLPVLMLMLVGCLPPSGGGGNEGAGGFGAGSMAGGRAPIPGPPGVVDRFNLDAADVLAQYVCHQTYACVGESKPTALGRSLSNHPDEAACRRHARSRLEAELRVVTGDEVRAGLIAFNAARASACLDAIARLANTCAPLAASEADELCEGVAQGRVEADGACSRDAQCVSGYCLFERELEFGCGQGTCLEADGEGPVGVQVRPQAEGEFCEWDSQCTGALICLESECHRVLYLELGEECTVGDLAAACRPSTVCRGTSGGQGACASPARRGAACVDSAECGPGLYCKASEQDDGVAGACLPLEGAEAACESNQQCEPGIVCRVDTRRCGERQSCPLPMSAREAG